MVMADSDDGMGGAPGQKPHLALLIFFDPTVSEC
jgi:hypothetical protein